VSGGSQREALRGWWQLPETTRREVRQLSREGKHYPDRAVAWVAWRWAEAVLPVGSPEPGRLRNMLSAAGFWLQIAAEMATGTDPTDPPKPQWLDRRRARPLLRLGPPVG
jgi:hypothetical protein